MSTNIHLEQWRQEVVKKKMTIRYGPLGEVDTQNSNYISCKEMIQTFHWRTANWDRSQWSLWFSAGKFTLRTYITSLYPNFNIFSHLKPIKFASYSLQSSSVHNDRTISNSFTKWLEVYPIPDQTAETCAAKILDEYIGRFGCPLSLHSDQWNNFERSSYFSSQHQHIRSQTCGLALTGTECWCQTPQVKVPFTLFTLQIGSDRNNFESDIFRQLCLFMGIRKTRTSVRNPKGNGCIERSHRTLLQMIRAYLKGEQSEYSSKIFAAHVSAVWSGIGYTSNHFVKLSVTVRMYLFPRGVLGKGPTISVATQSKGPPNQRQKSKG
jgi:hypothetical protein